MRISLVIRTGENVCKFSVNKNQAVRHLEAVVRLYDKRRKNKKVRIDKNIRKQD